MASASGLGGRMANMEEESCPGSGRSPKLNTDVLKYPGVEWTWSFLWILKRKDTPDAGPT